MNQNQNALVAYKSAFHYGDSQLVYEDAGAFDLNYASNQYTQGLLTKAVAKYPFDPKLWLDLSMVYAKEGDLSSARHAIEHAEQVSDGQINPNVAAAIYNGQPFEIGYGGKTFLIP